MTTTQLPCPVYCVACAELVHHVPYPYDEAHCHCFVAGTPPHCVCPCHDDDRGLSA